jgi:hypothetical protein
MIHMSTLPPELEPFMCGGRLTKIPGKRAKRLKLLDYIAQSFEPGRKYHESEISEALRAMHDDYAALRRYLVDEDFLSREAGIYWRSGGTVDVTEAE